MISAETQERVKETVAKWLLWAYTMISITVTNAYEGALSGVAKLFVWYYNSHKSGFDLRFELNGSPAQIIKAVIGVGGLPKTIEDLNASHYDDVTPWMKFFMTFYRPTMENLRFYTRLNGIKRTHPLHVVLLKDAKFYTVSIDINSSKNLTSYVELYSTDDILGVVSLLE